MSRLMRANTGWRSAENVATLCDGRMGQPRGCRGAPNHAPSRLVAPTGAAGHSDRSAAPSFSLEQLAATIHLAKFPMDKKWSDDRSAMLLFRSSNPFRGSPFDFFSSVAPRAKRWGQA